MQSQVQMPLSGMIKGQMFEGFLLVKAAEQRTSSNGSKYLDMTLSDVSGEVNAKMWDGAATPPGAGKVIRLRGMMLEYNGKPQLRVDKFRLTLDSDHFDMALLMPCAPEPPQNMMDYVLNRADAIVDKELKALVLLRLEEAGDKIYYYPAAQKLHHAERSGLLHHTSTMLRTAQALCEIYPQLDGDLLAAGVILHDLCKIEELCADETGVVSEYSVEGQLLGHLVQGVSALGRAAEKLGTRRELTLMLQHMILSHHDLPEYGSPRRPMFPEAEVLHIIDQLDARMFEMDYALRNTAPGGFTDRIWSLERKLYRREEQE